MTLGEQAEHKFFEREVASGTIINRLSDAGMSHEKSNLRYDGCTSDQQSSQMVHFIGADTGDDSLNIKDQSLNSNQFSKLYFNKNKVQSNELQNSLQ